MLLGRSVCTSAQRVCVCVCVCVCVFFSVVQKLPLGNVKIMSVPESLFSFSDLIPSFFFLSFMWFSGILGSWNLGFSFFPVAKFLEATSVKNPPITIYIYSFRPHLVTLYSFVSRLFVLERFFFLTLLYSNAFFGVLNCNCFSLKISQFTPWRIQAGLDEILLKYKINYPSSTVSLCLSGPGC